MFFFSSRRRHTRSLCDWSSDVCSSDLYLIYTVHYRLNNQPLSIKVPHRVVPQVVPRSEERRVGKECRSRRSQDHENENAKSQSRAINWYHSTEASGCCGCAHGEYARDY